MSSDIKLRLGKIYNRLDWINYFNPFSRYDETPKMKRIRLLINESNKNRSRTAPNRARRTP